MHLLAGRPGGVVDDADAVDLDQSPADIVVLSAADTELACLAAAYRDVRSPAFPSLRLTSLLQLNHPMSVDLYVEKTVIGAKLVVVRLLGGRSYWPYGVEQLSEACAQNGTPIVFLPGNDQPDPELGDITTIPDAEWRRMWLYLVHGGLENAAHLLNYAANLVGYEQPWQEPKPLSRSGLYWPGEVGPDLDMVRQQWLKDAPVAAVVFYRALVQAGNVRPIDALINSLRHQGLNALPIFVSSLKDLPAAAFIEQTFAEAPPNIVLNSTGFAIGVPGAESSGTVLDGPGRPVLQVVFSGTNEDTWQAATHGLSPRDIAMNIALPEVDGRLITRAVSFKGLAERDPDTELDVIHHRPVDDRIDYVCRLAASWVRLGTTPPVDRRIGLVLANYPNKNSRIGNGVGLDTPASTLQILGALRDAGYHVGPTPENGNAIVERLCAGPTNETVVITDDTEFLSTADYTAFFEALPSTVRDIVSERWGSPETDPFFTVTDSMPNGGFALPTFRCGNIVIGLQPARGYNIDPTSSYHDPDLPPPHGYIAFYMWLTRVFDAHAIVHVGKHGNLEWLPGKALALSESCFPEAVFAPVPHVYPFIVNDPGEGTQAKRRTSAVIIDHLTPPLTRAESYGPLQDLERLIDEFFDASTIDPRRLGVLGDEILSLAHSTGIAIDSGIARDEETDEALTKLDRYLCELKELQIRDGLHIFGAMPPSEQLNDTLVAVARVPRHRGDAGDASLLRALAADLDLDFDPLDCDLAGIWPGPWPDDLTDATPWRTNGDTIERLENLAKDLVSGGRDPKSNWTATHAVLETIESTLRPAIAACADRELEGLLTGLDGRFVVPGPSGAPSRGRPDVLPTGRNFYSVDTRTVPTPAAWTLGWKAASLLVDRYVQDNGTWPRTLALSAWGTSNMRTGGDDIAQALALIGARPTWDSASRRVTGFEILPITILGRPRIDVTLRVSGFFRDAFSNLIELFDAAARAVSKLDESPDDNPLSDIARSEQDRYIGEGVAPADAERMAAARVFGSKPGAYGAGLQALIDEGGWDTDADLADAYVAWGGWSYGVGNSGEAAHETFKTRLSGIDVVLQNQDNREHDILDSDDYYQFQGGMTAAVRTLSGQQPTIYHGDNARPETPRVRALEEEVSRVVRARVVNPKWIAGAMRHGYKGAFEMAATVDYLFAYAATTQCVHNHHFDAVFDAFIDDVAVRDFIAENNASALSAMSDRLLEAVERGLWRPKRNSAEPTLASLSQNPFSTEFA
jgi:cobaltochelatase CobN